MDSNTVIQQSLYDREKTIAREASSGRSYGVAYLSALPDDVLRRYAEEEGLLNAEDTTVTPEAVKQKIIETLLKKNVHLSPEYTGGKY